MEVLKVDTSQIAEFSAKVEALVGAIDDAVCGSYLRAVADSVNELSPQNDLCVDANFRGNTLVVEVKAIGNLARLLEAAEL